MSTVSFDELVTVATVGVARKGRPAGELAGPAGQAGRAGARNGADPAADLLDAAALLTAARRAGLQPAQDVTRTGAEAFQPDGTERELSARAARLLRRVGPGDGELLADLLSAARDAGYVLPAPLLPVLLDAAVRDSELRPAVAGLLGTRGRWLAGHRPDWRRAVGQAQAAGAAVPAAGGSAPAGPGSAGTDSAGPGSAGTAPAGPGSAGTDSAGPGSAGTASADPGVVINDEETRTWRTGSRDERRGVLAALRRRDPAAGRELLAAGWGKETGTDRAALLDMLRHGLAAADEEFLEAALDDRAGGVRDTARQLLAGLPGSAFRRRAAERAAPLLRVERPALRRRLAVTLPGEPDQAALRDGVPASCEVKGIGDGGWRLMHVLAAAPLDGWTKQLGLPPAELAALPVADDLVAYVHAAWRRAVEGQRGTDALAGEELTAWALALLAADADRVVKWGYRAWPDDARLTGALPAAIRAERAAGLLNRADAASPDAGRELAAEVAACPTPWPPALADAVAGVLTRAAAAPNLPALLRSLLTTAGRGLPAAGPRDYAAVLARLAAAEPPWSSLLNDAAETIALRRAFLAELRLPGQPRNPVTS